MNKTKGTFRFCLVNFKSSANDQPACRNAGSPWRLVGKSQHQAPAAGVEVEFGSLAPRVIHVQGVECKWGKGFGQGIVKAEET